MLAKRSKYGNKKTKYDNLIFDSKMECERYKALKILERAGKISELKVQVPFVILPAVHEEVVVQLKTKTKTTNKKVQSDVKYKADFTYIENGQLVVEDVKGALTGVYKLKKKMMKYFHGINIKEYYG